MPFKNLDAYFIYQLFAKCVLAIHYCFSCFYSGYYLPFSSS